MAVKKNEDTVKQVDFESLINEEEVKPKRRRKKTEETSDSKTEEIEKTEPKKRVRRKKTDIKAEETVKSNDEVKEKPKRKSKKKAETENSTPEKETKSVNKRTVRTTKAKSETAVPAAKDTKSTTRGKSISVKSETATTKRKTKPKRDRKINVTREDMDKLCEVYDWYLSVKETVNKRRKSRKEKDIIIEDLELKDTKKAYLNIDRETWEDFDRLCSNAGYKKNEVLTQIIKEFIREHGSLI